MSNFNAAKLIELLKSLSNVEKNKKARNYEVITSEIDNVLMDLKISLKNQSAEDTIKFLLWQGLLNQFGIFGSKRNEERTFGRSSLNYYSRKYNHGDLLSIDFGTSNFGKEFSYTHTAIVIADYTEYVVVVPTTSCKEGRLEDKPCDEVEVTMTITDKDFVGIESDSYILMYQIKSVSKNRITKYIGSISDTKLMKEIDKKLIECFTLN